MNNAEAENVDHEVQSIRDCRMGREDKPSGVQRGIFGGDSFGAAALAVVAGKEEVGSVGLWSELGASRA